jgi:hypothetical protein
MRLGRTWSSSTNLAIDNEIETTIDKHFGLYILKREKNTRTMKAMT